KHAFPVGSRGSYTAPKGVLTTQANLPSLHHLLLITSFSARHQPTFPCTPTMHCRYMLLLVVFLQNMASAQSPPPPQPGVGVNPSVASAAADLGGTPTARALDSNHPTITASSTSP